MILLIRIECQFINRITVPRIIIGSIFLVNLLTKVLSTITLINMRNLIHYYKPLNY